MFLLFVDCVLAKKKLTIHKQKKQTSCQYNQKYHHYGIKFRITEKDKNKPVIFLISVKFDPGHSFQ